MDSTDAEGASLGDRLSTDDAGKEVLVGLTAEESEFYMQYRRRRKAGYYPERKHRDRFVQLHEKHELARSKGRKDLED